MNKYIFIIGIILFPLSFGGADSHAANGKEHLQPVYHLLLARHLLPKPVYKDSANIPELTGGWYGAMGEHPVKKVSIANPAYPDGIDDDDGNHYSLNVDLYLPADMTGKRPTVFFIAGWHVYHSETYRSLLYFIASQGFNCVYVPYHHPDPTNNPDLLLNILDRVVADFAPIIDTTRIGYMGHSEGGGLAFYLAKDRPQWGTNGRFIFSLAAWWGFNLPATGNVDYPSNTNMIVQMYNPDYDTGTDPRQNIDFLLHNNIPAKRKTYLYLPGDADHISDHGVSYSDVAANGEYIYDALEQVGIYRPLESLMRYSFENDTQWKKIGLPDDGDENYNVEYQIQMPGNDITVLSTDTPLQNTNVPIPAEAALDANYLCHQHDPNGYYNPRWQMCMPCGDTDRDANWEQCQ